MASGRRLRDLKTRRSLRDLKTGSSDLGDNAHGSARGASGCHDDLLGNNLDPWLFARLAAVAARLAALLKHRELGTREKDRPKAKEDCVHRKTAARALEASRRLEKSFPLVREARAAAKDRGDKSERKDSKNELCQTSFVIRRPQEKTDADNVQNCTTMP